MTSASQIPKVITGTCPPLPSESSAPRSDENPLVCSRLTRESQLLVWCARSALDETATIRIRNHIQGILNWSLLCDLAGRHGVGVLLHRSLMAICPDAIPADIAQQLKRYAQASTLRNRILSNELLVLIEAFRSRGIAVIPFKGPTLSLMAYGDVAFRECGDLDFIVRQDSVSSARKFSANRDTG